MKGNPLGGDIPARAHINTHTERIECSLSTPNDGARAASDRRARSISINGLHLPEDSITAAAPARRCINVRRVLLVFMGAAYFDKAPHYPLSLRFIALNAPISDAFMSLCSIALIKHFSNLLIAARLPTRKKYGLL
jgi:hypothetical protein